MKKLISWIYNKLFPEFPTALDTMVIGPEDEETVIMYVRTNRGKLYRSDDRGITWSESTSPKKTVENNPCQTPK